MSKNTVTVGLFDQKISLGLSDPNYLIEKVEIGKIVKNKIELLVAEGTCALIGGNEYLGRNQVYNVYLENLVPKKNEECVAYLYSTKFFDKISFKFPVDVYSLGIDVLKGAKGKYALNAQANVEISDYKELVLNYGKTVTREALLGELETKIRAELSGVVKTVASQLYSSELTSTEFLGKVQDEIDTILREIRRGTSINSLGLVVNKSSIKFYMNEMAETKEYIAKITGKINEGAEYHIGDDKRRDENEKLQKEREHEINLKRADHTKIEESTQNITKNINGTESSTKKQETKKFCPNCGTKLTSSNAKFCSNCGTKL